MIMIVPEITLVIRGGVDVGDITRNLARLKPDLKMIHWNPDSFKV